MGSIFGRFFGERASDQEDDVLGCDMVPAPTVLATMFEPVSDDVRMPAAAFGPFTTAAQAPIRDS